VDAEYRQRSPLPYLEAARGLAIDLNAGIHDGHSGSVPVGHTLSAFNRLAEANGFASQRLNEADIRSIEATQLIPARLQPATADPSYAKRVLLRRVAGPVRVTLFEGGHEILPGAAFAWLAQQVRKSSDLPERR
jgi:hypothetical protein